MLLVVVVVVVAAVAAAVVPAAFLSVAEHTGDIWDCKGSPGATSLDMGTVEPLLHTCVATQAVLGLWSEVAVLQVVS